MIQRETKRSIQAASEKRQQELAVLAFDKHQICTLKDDRIEIRAKHPDGLWTSMFAVEMILLRTGLLVYGDISHVVFGYYQAPSLLPALRWMGDQPMGSSYVREKANIGMRLERLNVPFLRITYAHAAVRKAVALLQEASTHYNSEDGS